MTLRRGDLVTIDRSQRSAVVVSSQPGIHGIRYALRAGAGGTTFAYAVTLAETAELREAAYHAANARRVDDSVVREHRLMLARRYLDRAVKRGEDDPANIAAVRAVLDTEV